MTWCLGLSWFPVGVVQCKFSNCWFGVWGLDWGCVHGSLHGQRGRGPSGSLLFHLWQKSSQSLGITRSTCTAVAQAFQSHLSTPRFRESPAGDPGLPSQGHKCRDLEPDGHLIPLQTPYQFYYREMPTRGSEVPLWPAQGQQLPGSLQVGWPREAARSSWERSLSHCVQNIPCTWCFCNLDSPCPLPSSRNQVVLKSNNPTDNIYLSAHSLKCASLAPMMMHLWRKCGLLFQSWEAAI